MYVSSQFKWELLQVGATPDLMVAYIDFFLGGDEKRLDIVSIIEKRFPMCILFGGDGSYMSPYSLHSDLLLTNLLGQVHDLFFILLEHFSLFKYSFNLLTHATSQIACPSICLESLGGWSECSVEDSEAWIITYFIMSPC